MFAQVAFNRPIEPLTYVVPENMSSVRAGVRVKVPLRNTSAAGIVYTLSESSTLKELKSIHSVLDQQPVLNQDLIETARWISEYYLCSIGEALWTISPKGYKKRHRNPSMVRHTGRYTNETVLTSHQQDVLEVLKASLEGKANPNSLLYGVTGSGKTEIYLRIIDEVVKRNKGAILLVPEISLTPQTVDYFARRMGEQLAILHSRLTSAEKINEWYGVLCGEKKVVIGARSAVFAPLEQIGIIIIDEEHENSYKSEETPRYNARSVAFYRARKHRAALLMGSATPSVESFYLAKRDKFNLLTLPHRVLNQKLPATHISDLRKVKSKKYISNPLMKAIHNRLKRNEQVILFLNRRGYSPYVFCENCGYVFRCKNCDITMTYHYSRKVLSCHYCNYTVIPPEVCPACEDENISYAGFGTEKIEQVLGEYFPGAVIVRMDTDSLKKRTSVGTILQSFSEKQIDILVGTQIVTKGLHFPNVTLVGVLNADIPLNFPDFRSAERTFNLITQVAGRAGRSPKGGEVIIQTYNPVHYAIQAAKTQGYEEFFEKEIKYRQALVYPPFCRIIRLVFRGQEPQNLFRTAEYAVSFIREKSSQYISILGPSRCPLSKIKKNYRVHVIIKMTRMGGIKAVLYELNSIIKKKHGVYFEIDIDPASML
ncbi:MAG: replication restart helicase PriA [Spirochaetota bacterium]